MHARTDVISALAGKIHGLIPSLAATGEGYALLDFPDYANVGDSLIWLGELAYFRQAGAGRPNYVSTRDGLDPEALKRACPTGPIFLSGGGNFGDLWPKFQAFRIRVLREFPDRTIIQLPQSIHFTDPANAEPTRRAIAGHGNFKMLVRDRRSLAFASEMFDCEINLCPDMAFCIGPVSRTAPASCDVVLLLRTDLEKLDSRGERIDTGALNAITADWIEPPKKTLGKRVINRAMRNLPGGVELAFHRQAEAQMARGVSILQQGRMVVTDRLHGHILSVLLRLPHIVIDNSYGKVRSFAEEWTSGDSVVRLADHPDQASPLLQEMAEEISS